ncbi:4-phosphoerythronate dehydrogenase [Thalassotalea mangrovi]|uniref:Erythronate-4-phosphate dehydrogenase n=1 Tax=Thalassotalea mangrovi TaxID=2572245 RepID=A0A4U1B514_9GAMM|nr:4-phosphoerythronate dehydrogenase [Thalassotalea mangrovi]TKB45088.1 4-phosphoerythronate dehydrogenase [Thalassotalea mangrovi]
MNIYFDENIPFASEFFAGFGNLKSFSGRDVDAETIADADVLLVRSITRVDEKLLSANHRIQFVGTATIGVDHIDTDYLLSRNISFASAPGCNATSVGEYVISALLVICQRMQANINDFTVGIVGAGNTGSALARKLAALKVPYKLYDPLLATTDDREFVEFSEILTCDAISLHVPLTRDGEYPTFHLFDESVIKNLSPQQILINACRGEVVDNQALLQQKLAGGGPQLVLDVWENEPNVLVELIEYCQVATAHIAGYSLEGKSRGTEMLYQALCHLTGLESKLELHQFMPAGDFILRSEQTPKSGLPATMEEIYRRVFQVYDVRRDDQIFRQQLLKKGFDAIRKNYPVRREFSALNLSARDSLVPDMLKSLGFSIQFSRT